jgi:hypothetical protein
VLGRVARTRSWRLEREVDRIDMCFGRLCPVSIAQVHVVVPLPLACGAHPPRKAFISSIHGMWVEGGLPEIEEELRAHQRVGLTYSVSIGILQQGVH